MKAIVFGCGGVGAAAKEKLEADGMKVIAFADNNEKKWGTIFEECKVISPNEIGICDYDFVAIGVFKNVSSIRKQLCDLNVPEEKIIVPIEPKNKIFVNPTEYTREQLVTLAKENYESKSTKDYEKRKIVVEDELFLANLEDLKRVLLENRIPREKVCVVKGAVMVAYGLRTSKRFEDIDIIMTEDLRELYGTGHVWISDNVEMNPRYYMHGRSDDEIINDVNKHFVFSDLKFMNLEDFYEYKKEIRLVRSYKPGLKEDLNLLKKFFD